MYRIFIYYVYVTYIRSSDDPTPAPTVALLVTPVVLQELSFHWC